MHAGELYQYNPYVTIYLLAETHAVNPGATVVLDGSASSDPDGDQISFSWRQTAGPTITLQGASTANPSFNAPAVTTQTVLTFELRVRSEEHTSELQSRLHLVCRLLLEKKN